MLTTPVSIAAPMPLLTGYVLLYVMGQSQSFITAISLPVVDLDIRRGAHKLILMLHKNMLLLGNSGKHKP